MYGLTLKNIKHTLHGINVKKLKKKTYYNTLKYFMTRVKNYWHVSTLLYNINFGSPESYKYKDSGQMAHEQMSCDPNICNPNNFLLI